jgi:lipoprotein-anchoring transpeptidase ErfK/SrfK
MDRIALSLFTPFPAFVIAILLAAPFPVSGALKKLRTAPEPDSKDVDTITRVQIFLDESFFGPGKIDGGIGQFTRSAVAHYNYVFNLQPDNWFQVIQNANKSVKDPYAAYTITQSDISFVADVPAEPEEQAKLKALSYRSLAEMIAERFHTDEKFLGKLNPNLNWNKATAGSEIRVPNVTPFCIEAVPKHKQFKPDEKLSKRLVIVDTKQRLAAIWEGEKLIAMFPITPGQEKFIHRGQWTINIMVTTPEFRWDSQMLHEGKRSDVYYQLPPGPNSPIGIFWAGINKSGIGLHGTNSPHTIGRSESAGCIRFANWDAIRLSELVRPGASVEMR